MDIGDASEIPSTRKKLPSLQELGAFDLDSPSAARRPLVAPSARSRADAADSPTHDAGAAATAVAAVVADATEAPTDHAQPPAAASQRPQATRAQLRNALAKADPATRSRLLRLIAGGRSVELTGAAAGPTAHKPRQLLMRLGGDDAAAANAGPARRSDAVDPPAPAREAQRQPGRPANAQARRSAAEHGAPLLQIDANTDLLAAVTPPPSDAERRAAIGAQFAALRAEPPATADSAAPKVLFPSYDPNRHGDDIRRPGRRADGPVEGHFPAPRQPFEARYRHADGRPMDAEESKVEAVLQAQRCDRTLEVLARDGVNGLLLSPRDLDAAVENGTLDAATASLLWKTWSALRPVIHVIDEPAPVEAADDAGDDPAAAPPQTPAGEGAAAPAAFAATAVVESAPPALAAAPAPPLPPLVTPPPLEAVPPAAVPLASVDPAAAPVEPSMIAALPLATRRQRAAMLLRQLWRIFVAVCVLSTSARIAIWGWLYWGHWIGR